MPETLYAFRRDLAQRIKRNNGTKAKSGVGGKVTHIRKPVGGDRSFFVLLEDAEGEYGPAWARETDRTGVENIRTFQIYWWDSLLSGAKAGYKSTMQPVGSEDVFEPGACIVRCFSDGSITSSSATPGVVGEEYGFTIGSSGIDADSITAEGLPPGLSMDENGVTTGTPTESGTHYVIVSGTADKTGPGTVAEGAKCTVTKVVIFTVTEEE